MENSEVVQNHSQEMINNFRQDVIKSTKGTLLLELSYDQLKTIGEGDIIKGSLIILDAIQRVYNKNLNPTDRLTNLIYIDPREVNKDSFLLYDAVFNILDERLKKEYNKSIAHSSVKAIINVGIKTFLGGSIIEALDEATGNYLGSLRDQVIDYVSDEIFDEATDIVFDKAESYVDDHIDDKIEEMMKRGIVFFSDLIKPEHFKLDKETLNKIKELDDSFNAGTTSLSKLFDFIVSISLALTIKENKAIIIKDPHLLDKSSHAIITKIYSIAKDIKLKQDQFFKITFVYLYTQPNYQPNDKDWKDRISDKDTEENLIPLNSIKRQRHFLMRYGLLETPVSDIPKIAVKQNVFVGRKEELEELCCISEQVLFNSQKEVKRRADVIIGEPGVGKTKLYYEFLRRSLYSRKEGIDEKAQNAVIRLKVLNEPGMSSSNSGLSSLERSIVEEIDRLENYYRLNYKYETRTKNALDWLAKKGVSLVMKSFEVEDIFEISKSIKQRLGLSERIKGRDDSAKKMEKDQQQQSKDAYYETLIESIAYLQLLSLKIKGQLTASDTFNALSKKNIPWIKKQNDYRKIIESGGFSSSIHFFIDDVQWVDEETARFVINYLLPLHANLHIIATGRAQEHIEREYAKAYDKDQRNNNIYKLLFFENFQLFSKDKTKWELYNLSNEEKTLRGFDNSYFNHDDQFKQFNQTLFDCLSKDESKIKLDLNVLDSLALGHICLKGLNEEVVTQLIGTVVKRENLPALQCEETKNIHWNKASTIAKELMRFHNDPDYGRQVNKHTIISDEQFVNTLIAVETVNVISDEQFYKSILTGNQQQQNIPKQIIQFKGFSPYFTDTENIEGDVKSIFMHMKEKYLDAFNEQQGSFNLGSYAVMEERVHLIQEQLGTQAYYAILLSAFTGFPFHKEILKNIMTALNSSSEPLFADLKNAFQGTLELTDSQYETLEVLYDFMKKYMEGMYRYKHALIEEYLTTKIEKELEKLYAGYPERIIAVKEKLHELVYMEVEKLYIDKYMEPYDLDAEQSIQCNNYFEERDKMLSEVESGEITQEEFDESQYVFPRDESEWWDNIDELDLFTPVPYQTIKGDSNQEIQLIDKGYWDLSREDVFARNSALELMMHHARLSIPTDENVAKYINLVLRIAYINFTNDHDSYARAVMNDALNRIYPMIENSRSSPSWLKNTQKQNSLPDLLNMSMIVFKTKESNDSICNKYNDLMEKKYSQYPSSFAHDYICSLKLYADNTESDDFNSYLEKRIPIAENVYKNDSNEYLLYLNVLYDYAHSIIDIDNDRSYQMISSPLLPLAFNQLKEGDQKAEECLNLIRKSADDLLELKGEKAAQSQYTKMYKTTKELYESDPVKFLRIHLNCIEYYAVHLEEYDEQNRDKEIALRREGISILKQLYEKDQNRYIDELLDRMLIFAFALSDNGDDVESRNILKERVAIYLPHYEIRKEDLLSTYLDVLKDLADSYYDIDYDKDFSYERKSDYKKGDQIFNERIQLAHEYFKMENDAWIDVYAGTIEDYAITYPKEFYGESVKLYEEIIDMYWVEYRKSEDISYIEKITTKYFDIANIYSALKSYKEVERIYLRIIEIEKQYYQEEKYNYYSNLANVYKKTKDMKKFNELQDKRYAEAKNKYLLDGSDGYDDYVLLLELIADDYRDVDRTNTLNLQEELLALIKERYKEDPDNYNDNYEDILGEIIKSCKALKLKNKEQMYKNEQKMLKNSLI